MNEAEAFEAWKREQFEKGIPRLAPSEAWKAALKWQKSNHIPDATKMVDAAQINEQMREALQFVVDCQESTNGSDYESGSALREAASMAKAALAATPK